MKIRNIESQDIEKCCQIYNYYIENTCYTLEEKKLSLDDFKARVESINAKFPYIVVENDAKEVIGYAYLNTFNSRSAYKITADLSIYISKDHLGEHVGSLLLNQIEKLALKQGIKNIISIVTSENENSFKFHIKNGFELQGTIKDVAVKFSKVISVHYFKKVISKIDLN